MPLITLTSDIGSPDYLVGAVKAQLLQLNPDFQIVDISHNIPPFNYPQAAYVCRSAIKNFPEFLSDHGLRASNCSPFVSPQIQCLKCLEPVKIMLTSSSSQTAMTSASRTEPPGEQACLGGS